MRVNVGCHGPFRFLLDTGASRSVVSERVMGLSGAAITGRTLMMTPSGHMVRPTVTVAIQIGAQQSAPATVTVIGDDVLAPAAGVDGIIGQDVLSSLVYTIDYGSRVIYWDARVEADPDSPISLRFTDGRAVTFLPAAGAGTPLRMIPDTGSDGLVIFAGRGRSLPTMTPLNVGLLRTLTGQRLVRRVVLDALQVGSVRLEQQVGVMMPEGRTTLPFADGLLPLHLFSRVTINGPAGYIAVEK